MRRAELAGRDTKAERELRLQIGALAESAARAPRRGDRRLRAGAGDLRQRSRRRAGARSALHQGRTLGRSDAPARGPAQARRAARARSGRHPLPDGADRARSAERSRDRARAPARGAVRRSRPPRRHHDAGGDARRHRRAGAGRRAARAGVRGARRLAVADQDRRDPPAADRGAGRSGSPGRSGSRASSRSSWRTTTAPCAGTARCSRRRRPSASAWSSSFAWPTSSIAGRTWRACSPNYLEGELGEEPAVLDIVRRTAEIFDHRLGRRPEAEKYYRRLFDARPDDRDVAQLFEGALERWGAWQELRELDRRGGRARRRPGGEAGAAAPERQARRGEAGQPRARDRDAARGDGRRSRRSGTAAELERLLGAEGQWHDLADHLAATLDRLTDAREGDAARLRLAQHPARAAGGHRRGRRSLRRGARTDARPAAGGRGAGVAGRAATPSATASPSSWSRSTGGSGDLGKLVGALDAELESSTTAPSGCASCARWRRSISASAGRSGRSTAAAAPG